MSGHGENVRIFECFFVALRARMRRYLIAVLCLRERMRGYFDSSFWALGVVSQGRCDVRPKR